MKNLNPSLWAILGLLLSGVVTSSAATLTWDADPNTTGAQDGSGIWDTTTNTWWDGLNNLVWANSLTGAAFGAGNGTAGTVTLGVPITVPVFLTFDPPGSGSYTLSGIAANVLTLTSGPTINANADAAINAVLAGEAFTKLGAGQLSLQPPADNTYVGTTFVNVGTLVLNSSATSRILIPGNLTINSGATVTNAGSSGPVADTATVTVNPGGTYSGRTDVINTLVLAGGTVVQVGTETLTAATIDARSGAIIEAASATGKLDGNLTKSTAGTVTLFSRGSVAAGGLTNTIVNAGTLVLDYTQTTSKLADAGTLTVNGGTLVFTNGATETVGSFILAGGVITNASSTGDLRVPTGGNFDVRSGSAYIVLGSGSGRTLTKTTPGIVILAATNTYSGGTTISEGILQLGDGVINGSVNSGTITDNATLVLNPSAVAVSVAVGGSGSLVKIGGGVAAVTQVNTYQGNTTISNGVLSIDSDATLGDATGTLVLAGGTLSSTASRSVSSAPVANPVSLVADSAITTTSTAATVDLNLSNDSISGGAGTLTFRNDAPSGSGLFVPRLSGSGFNFTRPIVIANGAFGTTRLDSYNATGTTQTFSGAISGSGGYRRNASTAGSGGTTVFNGNNTYTGATDVNRGVVFVNGSLGGSVVGVGGNGTLGGNGTINGPVTVSSGGMLSVGTSIGRLTINNSLTLQANSTNVVEVSRNGSVLTNDTVTGLSSVTFAGTLIVNDVGPNALQLGDSFQLFNLGGSGSFTISGTPGGGNAWSFSPATGVLTVVASGAAPLLSFGHSGGSLQFSWTDALYKLQAQTNTLGTGLATNNSAWFDYPGGGSSPVTAPINPASGCVFFRLQKP